MKLGPYEIEGELGRGGMGVVFRGHAPDGRSVAIKVLLGDDDQALARFDRERRVLEELSSGGGFVPILDSGTSPRGPYLVMPLVPGGSLEKRLERGPLPHEDAVALVLELARALAKAHERGIVHRDLKPANVLFDERGRPLVSDLGLARHERREGQAKSLSLTQAGALAGTIGYAPPEQLDDAHRAGPAADVFALASILYECIAGRRPYSSGGIADYVRAIEQGAPEPLAQVAPGTPGWIDEVVARSLDRDPANRYPDALALARALADGSKARGGARGVILLSVVGVVLVGAGVAIGMRGRDPAKAPPKVSVGRSRESADEATRCAWQARECIELGDLENAKAYVNRALKLAKNDADVQCATALYFLARDKRDEATNAVEWVVKNFKTYGEGYYVRARVRAVRGEYDAALEDLARVIELYPDPADAIPARVARGDILLELNRPDEALADFDAAAEADKQAAEPIGGRAAALLDLRRIDDASRAVEWVLKRDRDEPRALETRARSLVIEGKLDDAFAAADRALVRNPRSVHSLMIRAKVLDKRGDRAAARADLERAAKSASPKVRPIVEQCLNELE